MNNKSTLVVITAITFVMVQINLLTTTNTA